MFLRWEDMLWGDSALEETNTENSYTKQEQLEGLPLSMRLGDNDLVYILACGSSF